MTEAGEKKKGARPVYRVLSRTEDGKFNEVGAVFKSVRNEENLVLRTKSGTIYYLVPDKKERKTKQEDISGLV